MAALRGFIGDRERALEIRARAADRKLAGGGGGKVVIGSEDGTSIVLGERGNEGNRVYTQQCGWSHLHFWTTDTFCNSGIIDRNDYDDEKNLNEQHKHNRPNETDRSAAAPKRAPTSAD